MTMNRKNSSSIHQTRRGLYTLYAVVGVLVTLHVCSQWQWWIETTKVLNDKGRVSEEIGMANTSEYQLTNKESTTAKTNDMTDKIETSSVDSGVSIQTDLEICKVVVDNLIYDHHMEVLEAIMAKAPLDLLPSICTSVGAVFDFKLSPYPRSVEWTLYANEYIRNRTYQSGNIQRRLGTVYPQHEYPVRKTPYAMNITSSCDCTPAFVDALTHDKYLVCMFHEVCPELANHSQAYWFHPDQPHSYFPNVLPQFDRNRSKATPPYRLCTIGEIVRRNYGMMELFLSNSSRRDFTFTIMGKGEIPSFFSKYNVSTHQSSTYSYLDYQREVATGCDVMLALIDQQRNSPYFTRSVMSGTMVQASAYKHPFVVHNHLAKVYGEYLKEQLIETHTDDPNTFVDALEKMLGRLDAINE
jgi:hypothetical protein